MTYNAKPKKNPFKWYRVFVVFPHRTIDGYKVVLGRVWKRQNKNITSSHIFTTYGREYAVSIPLEDGMKEPSPERHRKFYSCIVCDEKQYPLCAGCKKAILALKAICDGDPA